jgi:hypothetical protein
MGRLRVRHLRHSTLVVWRCCGRIHRSYACSGIAPSGAAALRARNRCVRVRERVVRAAALVERGS